MIQNYSIIEDKKPMSKININWHFATIFSTLEMLDTRAGEAPSFQVLRMCHLGEDSLENDCATLGASPEEPPAMRRRSRRRTTVQRKLSAHRRRLLRRTTVHTSIRYPKRNFFKLSAFVALVTANQ